MRKLNVLCGQAYEGSTEMHVTPCTRCHVGWNKKHGICTIITGAEHLPAVRKEDVPTCPIQDNCQHQIQRSTPCAVRRAGMICESVFIYKGMPREDAMEHPLAFNASTIA